jgi:hypothetical protein
VQKILAALDEPTELDFTQQPLSDVVEYLKAKHDVEIVFDRKLPAKRGIEPYASITFKIDDVTLRKALDAMLDPLGLAVGIRHEVLLITTKPLAASSLDLPEIPAGQRLAPKLGESLAELTECNFNDHTLSDAVEYFKAKHKIEISLDVEALSKARVGSDTLLSMNVKGITLKSALELMLEPLDLTSVADGDTLVIRPSTAK